MSALHTTPRHTAPSTMVFSAIVSDAEGGRPHLGVVAKRRYPMRRGALGPGSPAEIVAEPQYAERGDDTRLVHDGDRLCLHKLTTDVVLEGAAYAHRGPVTELLTALRAGAVHKDVLVTGDRRLKVGALGALSSTRAAPFERMALGWHRAYGGRDRGSERSAPAPRSALAAGIPSVDELAELGANSYLLLATI